MSTPFDYISQAVSKVVAAGTVLNLGSYDYLARGNSLFGCYLQPGAHTSLLLELDRGRRYCIIGGGDQDIEDLDIRVETESGALVIEDRDADPSPVVTFAPDCTQKFVIKIINYRSAAAGFCAFVIMEGGQGSTFVLDQLTEALGNAMRTAQVAGIVAHSFNETGFCLFGGKLSSRGESGLYDMAFRDGSYVMLTAGSARLEDVDCFVIRQYRRGQTEGETIASDAAPDSHPVCFFNADGANRHYLKHKNASSTSGFVFSVVLRLR